MKGQSDVSASFRERPPPSQSLSIHCIRTFIHSTRVFIGPIACAREANANVSDAIGSASGRNGALRGPIEARVHRREPREPGREHVLSD